MRLVSVADSRKVPVDRTGVAAFAGMTEEGEDAWDLATSARMTAMVIWGEQGHYAHLSSGDVVQTLQARSASLLPGAIGYQLLETLH